MAEHLVRRYPLLSFFLLAYGVSWLAWAPYILSADGFGVLPFRFPELLGDTQLAGIMPGAYLGPLAAAFTVTALTEGRAGLRRWRSRLLRWRVGLRWYALTLIGFPVLVLTGTLLLPGGTAAFHLPGPEFLLLFGAMLVMQFFTSGLAEEPGWRDFALHRLQQRLHPLVATLVLGVLWAGWHVPLFLTVWTGRTADAGLLGQFLLMTLGLTVVITWVYNRAGQSLPLVILVHAAFNTTASVGMAGFFPGVDAKWTWSPVLAVGALAVVLVVATRGRLGHAGVTTRSRVVPSALHPSDA